MDQLRAIQKRQTPLLASRRRDDFVPKTAISGWEPSSAPRVTIEKFDAAKCWTGWERVPGTKEYAEDSCRRKGSGKESKKKSGEKKRRKKKSGEDGSETDTSSSSSDNEK